MGKDWGWGWVIKGNKVRARFRFRSQVGVRVRLGSGWGFKRADRGALRGGGQAGSADSTLSPVSAGLQREGATVLL